MPRATPQPTQNLAQEAGVAQQETQVPPVVAPPPARQRRQKKKAQKARQTSPHRPARIHSPRIEPMEQQIGQDRERVMKSTGDAEDSLDPIFVEPVDRPVDPEKLEMLAFMEELVTVQIHTSNDQEQVFEIFNNGQREVFKRGEVKTVKRKFVNGLASAKLTTYSQKKILDEDGVATYVQIPHTALKYPFSMIEDKHPRGADWLRFVLAAA